MGTQRFCDVCKLFRQRTDGSPDVVRYTLRRELDQTREHGQRTLRHQTGAGGIDLCGSCWEAICKPRMNPKKAHRKAVA